ncbi:hypothetical protein BX600DRAFT_447606, partial [Xylariales sp. PMI_506]
ASADSGVSPSLPTTWRTVIGATGAESENAPASTFRIMPSGTGGLCRRGRMLTASAHHSSVEGSGQYNGSRTLDSTRQT